MRRLLFATVLFAASSARAEEEPYPELATLARAIHHIERNHVSHPAAKKLVEDAIRGMVAGLDRYSSYLSPDEYAHALAQAEAASGIGVFVDRRGARTSFVEVLPGSPADRAQITTGEALHAVAGESVAGLSVAEIRRRLRGRTGERVSLLVGDPPRALDVARGPRPDPTVFAERLAGERMYLKIATFADDTAGEVDRILDGVNPARLKGLVLDLRDNTGGLIDAAVRIADRFIENGVIVTIESTRGGAKVERAHPAGTHTGYPIVVLVNGITASSAEVLAAALQENGRASLVGTQSFGKGTVQTIIELDDRSALRLTLARYKTPLGRSLDGLGVRPDVVVSPDYSPPKDLDPTRADAQLARALATLR